GIRDRNVTGVQTCALSQKRYDNPGSNAEGAFHFVGHRPIHQIQHAGWSRKMKRAFGIATWIVIALLGAGALGAIALHRGELLNAIWFVIAAVCCYLVAFRLYSAFVA